MKSEVFFEYVANTFHEWLKNENIQRPVLFLVDGHKSHMSLDLSKFCDDNGIILYALPPNATHLLQPADVSVFKPMKEYWRQEVRNWQEENENRVVTKTEFCPILKRVLQHANMPSNMKNGFRACGLYPFNQDTVNYNKCVRNKLEKIINTEEIKNQITTADIQSTIKVILKLKDELFQHGISSDLIIGFVQSLHASQLNNDDLPFTAEEIDEMVMILEPQKEMKNETPNKEPSPNVIIIEDIVLNATFNQNEEQLSNEEPKIANSEETIPGVQLNDFHSSTIIEKETQLPSVKNCGSCISHNKNIDSHEGLKNTHNKGMSTNTETVKQINEKLNLHHEEGEDENNLEKEKIHLDEERKISDQDQTQAEESVNNDSEEGHRNVVLNEVPMLEQPESEKPTASCSFESHLSYPQVIKSTKKRQTEKIPSAISCKAWREYYENKLKEKEDKEKAKKKRKIDLQNKKISNNRKRVCKENISVIVDKDIENKVPNEIDNNGERSTKEQCAVCEEDLDSDAEMENEKNVGCDLCARWFHLGCTKFTGSKYDEVSKLDFTCDFCEE